MYTYMYMYVYIEPMLYTCTLYICVIGELMKYEDGQWKVIDRADRFKLCKTEGQVWLTLYQLLMDKDCQQKYEFNSHNKAVILKVHSMTSIRQFLE